MTLTTPRQRVAQLTDSATTLDRPIMAERTIKKLCKLPHSQ
ncbi:hypothetical protein SAMN05421693_1125 [Ectothiorhodospira magna]|uniref:Uncharacterized protein n=1 Tax=Ectothiorhodospira magna TaxID=867345 RepID=A0A1H9C2X5_9GAMM|nr:hypothetical protein SAMN05421693_1125 [Ectothiorhodospira magna]